MKKKIKIIDILCKINCNEEVPYKIKYVIDEYTYDYEIQDYYDKNYNYLFEELFVGYDTSRVLETEVEILESEDEFEDIREITQECFDNWTCAKHINQLIKNQKKIIERLKDE